MTDQQEQLNPTEGDAAAVAQGYKFEDVIATAKSVLTDTARFYREMPTAGGFGAPIFFLAVMAVIMAVILSLLSFVGFGMGGVGGIFFILFAPIGAIIGRFIGAGIMFLLWRLLGSELSFEGSYRCIAYASALYPVSVLLRIVPYLGTVLTVALAVYLLYQASVETHKIQQRKALIAMSIVGLLMLFSNLSGERQMRHMEASLVPVQDSMQRTEDALEQLGRSMEGYQQSGEEMTPEEAGRAVGDFFRGMNEALENTQQADSSAE